MASVWCWVQICSRLTQCCLSLASVAEKQIKEGEKNKELKPILLYYDDRFPERFCITSSR